VIQRSLGLAFDHFDRCCQQKLSDFGPAVILPVPAINAPTVKIDPYLMNSLRFISFMNLFKMSFNLYPHADQRQFLSMDNYETCPGRKGVFDAGASENSHF
jgi:hypothetical protein